MRRKLTYFGNPWIGMFVRANDSLTLAPLDCLPKVADSLEHYLGNPVHRVSIGESSIIGAYVALNSRGIILPNVSTKEEAQAIRKKGIEPYVSGEKNNAHGNNVVANDRGGLINPRIRQAERKRMEDALGVELVPMTIARYYTVGSCVIAGNKGFLAHFGATQDEMKAIEDALKVKGEKGSVNMGTGFVSLGIVGNSKGYVAGEETSAFEMGRAESALGYL